MSTLYLLGMIVSFIFCGVRIEMKIYPLAIGWFLNGLFMFGIYYYLTFAAN